MSDKQLQAVAQVTAAVVAVVLVGAGVAGWLLGRDLPAWLTTAIGMIIFGAFSHGAFFAQAKAATTAVEQLADLRSKYHELATTMIATTATTPTTSTPGEQHQAAQGVMFHDHVPA